MKKIILDARMINHSGIGTFIKNVLPHLISEASKKNYGLILLGDTVYLGRYGIKCLSANYPIYSVAEQIFIPQLLRREKPDLYHAFHYTIPLLYGNKDRIITTIHDLIHLIYPEYLPYAKLGYLYARFMLTQSVKKSRRVITISENSKKDIIRIIDNNCEEKISVIYPGVNTNIFHPFEENDKVTSRGYENYILSVGVIRPHKNTLALVEAFHKFLIKTQTNLRLILVGWGKPPYIDKVKRKVSELSLEDKVEFIEKIEGDKLAELYRRASMLVFPSLYEGFGLPPLEAMASGCPVISSNRASLPEVTGGVAGKECAAIMINPQNIDEISEAMEKLYSNETLRRKLIQKGLARASFFKWENTAQKIFQVWNEVLSE